MYVRPMGRDRWVYIFITDKVHKLILPQTDDTIARKINSSDASAFADICGCCPSQGARHFTLFAYNSAFLIICTVWGVIWLIIAFCFFAAGIIVGIVAFKVRIISLQDCTNLIFYLSNSDDCRNPQHSRKQMRSTSSQYQDLPVHLHVVTHYLCSLSG